MEQKAQRTIEQPFEKILTKKSKAQGAIEYLLIIGAALIVVAVVIIALSGIIGSGTNVTDTNAVNSTYDPLNCDRDIQYLGKVGTADCNAISGYKTTCKCCVVFPASCN